MAISVGIDPMLLSLDDMQPSMPGARNPYHLL